MRNKLPPIEVIVSNKNDELNYDIKYSDKIKFLPDLHQMIDKIRENMKAEKPLKEIIHKQEGHKYKLDQKNIDGKYMIDVYTFKIFCDL